MQWSAIRVQKVIENKSDIMFNLKHAQGSGVADVKKNDVKIHCIVAFQFATSGGPGFGSSPGRPGHFSLEGSYFLAPKFPSKTYFQTEYENIPSERLKIGQMQTTFHWKYGQTLM